MSEFVDYLSEVFMQFGPIQTRRMFGGHGIFRDGLMFALVADDIVYLKADEKAAPYFEELRLAQFEYEKKGKKMKMSYYIAPEEIYDDPDVAKLWASRAYEAAMRSKTSSRKVKKRAKSSR